jgi:hypothetical protein
MTCTESRDSAIALARGNSYLAPIFDELYADGRFFLDDGEEYWGGPNTDIPDDQVVGAYQVGAASAGGQACHVIHISGRKDAGWAISVGGTTEGEPVAVIYYDQSNPSDMRCLGQELEWPGLDAAVTKARLFMEVANG